MCYKGSSVFGVANACNNLPLHQHGTSWDEYCRKLSICQQCGSRLKHLRMRLLSHLLAYGGLGVKLIRPSKNQALIRPRSM